MPLVEYKDLSSNQTGETSSVVRQRVQAARIIQEQRFENQNHISTNSKMSGKLMRKFCQIDATASGYLEHAMTELNFSARAYDRILKVARTLADLEASQNIQPQHILEAIQYRTLDRKLMM